MHDAIVAMTPISGKPSLLLVVILVVGFGLLFKARHSGFAFALLAILGAGFAWSLLAFRSTTHVEHRAGISTYPDPTIIHDPNIEVFDLTADGVLDGTEATVSEVPLGQTSTDHVQPLLTQFSPQHEIVRNQRLAQLMPGGAVHGRASSGTWLETYPDGMQIEHKNRERRLIRDSDYDASTNVPQHAAAGSSYSSHSSYGRIALFAPLSIIVLALLAGFVTAMVARRHRRQYGDEAPRSGWATAAMAIGMIFFVVVGLAFFGYERVSHRSTSSPSGWTAYPPLSQLNGGAGNLFGAQRAANQALEQQQQQRALAHAAAAQQLADAVSQQASTTQQLAVNQLAAAIDHAPIEQLLSHLTAPRIMLTPPRSVSTTTNAQQELADAAKKILAATIPGADPFTQGWLVNAAKAIVSPVHPPAARDLAPVAAETPTPIAAPTPASPSTASAILRRSASEQTRKIAAIEKGIIEGRIPPAGGEKTIERLDKLRANLSAAAAVGAPKPRPDWLDNPPQFSGEVRRYVVSAGPYVTMAECEQALAREMRDIVQTRFRDAIASESGLPNGTWAYNPDVSNLGISHAFILREFCTDEYVEKVDASVGEMLKAHALLEFGPQEDALLVDYFKRWLRTGRVESAVILSSFAVIGLAFVFGLLKVDTWTRGYYTKRLFIGVPALIIAVGGIALIWAMQ